jgi:hypothetical protein
MHVPVRRMMIFFRGCYLWRVPIDWSSSTNAVAGNPNVLRMCNNTLAQAYALKYQRNLSHLILSSTFPSTSAMNDVLAGESANAAG